jgi:hypothetical protein
MLLVVVQFLDDPVDHHRQQAGRSTEQQSYPSFLPHGIPSSSPLFRRSDPCRQAGADTSPEADDSVCRHDVCSRPIRAAGKIASQWRHGPHRRHSGGAQGVPGSAARLAVLALLVHDSARCGF